MDTKDKKEKQLTLIEFNEQQQAFNFSLDGRDRQQEEWMPIGWMAHDDAALWTKQVKDMAADGRRFTTEDIVRRFADRPVRVEYAYGEVLMQGYMLCDELITLCDISGTYPKTTDAEHAAIVTTRNIFARLMAADIAQKVKASEFYDPATAENISRYVQSAEKADMLDCWRKPEQQAYADLYAPDGNSGGGRREGRTVSFGEMMHRLLKRFSAQNERKED